MRRSSFLALLLITISLLMNHETTAQRRPRAAPTPAATPAAAPPDVSYTVSMSKPWTHLLEIEMRLKWQVMPERLELKMPVWTPGSYLIREYARHVQNFSAAGADAGSPLAWQKINKNTWEIETKGAKEVAVKYLVYSNELTVRTNEVNDEHAFWNNAAALMFPKGQLSAPSRVRVVPYGNWRVATGLPAVEDQANTFLAENYDVLYDSPFEVSNFTEIKFEVLGKPHRYVISGEANYDPQRLVADTAKIIEETHKIFGELTYKDYTLIVNLRGGGGLEHMNSTALQTSRFGFKPDNRYKAFLSLVAHEFFHVFNVKSIRPDALGPFDYENENYTRLLWVAEGTTEYYSNLLLARAGIITGREFLRDMATGITALQNRPGRFETSLESASFDAWIKYYRQDENAVNNQVSYYDKGAIVSMMLDLAIRSSSNGTKSMDDVMRHLYAEFFKKNRNFTPADFRKAAELMAGKSLEDFFAKYVRGTADIEYNTFTNPLGLTMNARTPNAARAYIGADTVEADGRLNIRTIPAGTPAYEQGLNTGDQIIAIDGNRASTAFMTSYLNEKKPGDKVRITVFRYDRLRDFDFTLGGDTRAALDFAPIATADENQKRLYKQYLNADL